MVGQHCFQVSLNVKLKSSLWYTATVLYVLTVFLSPLVKPYLYLRLYKKVIHIGKKKNHFKKSPTAEYFRSALP